MTKLDFLNAHGLVDGRIPAGHGCTFARGCNEISERCPTEDAPREVAFSCARARLMSLVTLSRADGVGSKA